MARYGQVLTLAASFAVLVAGPTAWAGPQATPSSTSPAATNTTAPPTAAAPAAAATPAATPTPAATAPVATALAKPLPATRPGGYRLRNIKGVMAYCRLVTPIGTTLPTQECLTPDALDELLKHGQRQGDDMLQHMAICGNSSGACVAR